MTEKRKLVYKKDLFGPEECEINSLEGVVKKSITHINPSIHLIPRIIEEFDHPETYLSIDNSKKKLTLIGYNGRINCGEKVRVYSKDFTQDPLKNDCRVDYIEILDDEGRIINEAKLANGVYFKE